MAGKGALPRVRNQQDQPGGPMVSGVTLYEVIGVLPGAEPHRIKRDYEARSGLLCPDMTAGAPSNVLTAVARAQGLLGEAWQVLSDPERRRRYDEKAGLRRTGGGLGEPGASRSGTGRARSLTSAGCSAAPAGRSPGGMAWRSPWSGSPSGRCRSRAWWSARTPLLAPGAAAAGSRCRSGTPRAVARPDEWRAGA